MATAGAPPTTRLSPFGHALAGAGGAVLALTVTYPLDMIKTRLQVQTQDSAYSTDYRSAGDALRRIVAEEGGVAGLYSGLGSALLGVASTNFAYFYWYSVVRKAYLRWLERTSGGTRAIGTAMELLLGAVAAALAQLFTIPVAVITTRQQTHNSIPPTTITMTTTTTTPLKKSISARTMIPTGAGGLSPGKRSERRTFVETVEEMGVATGVVEDSVVERSGLHTPLPQTPLHSTQRNLFRFIRNRSPSKDRTTASSTTSTTSSQTPMRRHRLSMREAAQIIWQEDGLTGFWRGLRPSLVLTVNPAITYGLFERLKTALTARNLALTSGRVFSLGVLCKTIATVVTYPYIMAKVRMQWKPADYNTNEKVRYRSGVDVLRRIYHTEGVVGWYKGMQAQIIKAVLTQALLFVIKDRLTLYTYLLFVVLQRRGILQGAK